MASQHFINAPDSFYKYFSVLFSKCLLHGYMPVAMVLSTFIPIPKDNNDIQNSDKYWDIALSAICTMVNEYIILSIHGQMLTSNELQFAHKADTSTT